MKSDIERLINFFNEDDDEFMANIKENFLKQGIIPILIPGTSEVALLRITDTNETKKLKSKLEDTYRIYSCVEKVVPYFKRNNCSIIDYDIQVVEKRKSTMDELIKYMIKNSGMTIEEYIEKNGEEVEIKQDNGNGTFTKVYRKQTIEEILNPLLHEYQTVTYKQRITYKIKNIFNQIGDLEDFASSIYNYLYGEFKSFQLGTSYVKESRCVYNYNPEEEKMSFDDKLTMVKAFINTLRYEILLSEDINDLNQFWFSRFYQMQSKDTLLQLAGHYTSILKDDKLGIIFESIDINELLNNSKHSYMLTISKRDKEKVKSK